MLRQLIRSAGVNLIFLPKYSPDLNPIEQACMSEMRAAAVIIQSIKAGPQYDISTHRVVITQAVKIAQ